MERLAPPLVVVEARDSLKDEVAEKTEKRDMRELGA